MVDQPRILIVDDDPGMVETLADILELEGFDVVTVQDGHRAMDVIEAQAFQFIVMDLKMPGISGLDAFREIIRIDPAAKIVFMTAHYQEEAVRAAISEGAVGVLTKPLDIPKLLDVIHSVV